MKFLKKIIPIQRFYHWKNKYVLLNWRLSEYLMFAIKFLPNNLPQNRFLWNFQKNMECKRYIWEHYHIVGKSRELGPWITDF